MSSSKMNKNFNEKTPTVCLSLGSLGYGCDYFLKVIEVEFIFLKAG